MFQNLHKYAGIYGLQAPDICGQTAASIQSGFDLKLALVRLHCIATTSVSEK